MFEKLTDIEKRFEETEQRLCDPAATADIDRYRELMRERTRLEPLVAAYREWCAAGQREAEARELLDESGLAADLKELAREELAESRAARAETEQRLRELLLPRDPNDERNVIMEIRGGAGGEESALFAGSLYRMYNMYAAAHGFSVEVAGCNETELGGYKEISFVVSGEGAFSRLKYESGVHRVQRVPKTEAQGRIHTSTATVLCQPEAEDTDIEIDPKDLTIETHRASGAGGQHINKTDSAVRIVHLPTGITVNCQEGRSQIENRETAMRLIRARVYEELKRQKEEEEGKIRRAKIGTGDRSEKIRTYNYPQNRVTDHRIGLTITQLDRIMEGRLDDVIAGLKEAEEREKLEAARI